MPAITSGMSLIAALLTAAAVAALLSLCEERLRPAISDWWRNLQSWALGLGTGLLLLPVFKLEGLPSLIDGAALPFWIACPLFLLLRDFAEFAFHRAQHSIPFLWAMHSLHHSDPEMSALTTNRHFWGDQLIKNLTIWPLCAAIIAPTPAIFTAYAVASLWNYVVHARLKLDFGRLSWLLNSPSYHRRHHSSLPEHYNSNFAALFPIFDVIAGSYHRPDGFPPTGLDRKPESLGDLICWPLRHSQPADRPAPAQG